MRKTYKLFKRDFSNTFTTIGLIECSLFKKLNSFHTWSDAENYIFENPQRFAENDEITILPIWTKS